MMKKHIWISVVAVILAVAVSVTMTTYFFFNKYKVTIAYGASAHRYYTMLEAAELLEDLYVEGVEKDDLITGAVDGMIEALNDQWSYYMTADEVGSYRDTLTNSYVGVGVTVTKEDGQPIFVKKVEPSSGAEEAGIVPGDYITHVNGEDVTALSLDEAKNKIVGEENTTVGITVRHEDGTTDTYTVQRRRIETKTVTGQMIDDIGYIIIDNFNSGTGDEFVEAYELLERQGAKGFVYDVRFNNGGMVSELMQIFDYLLPYCVIFVSEAPDGERDLTYSGNTCVDAKPTVVLVNDSSYSAAEYFAAVLHEYDHASVAGQATTGKGHSQTTHYLSDGSAVVLSTRRYYTPAGNYLADTGFTPDRPLEVSDQEYVERYYGTLSIEDDSQLQLALEMVNDMLD